MPQLRNRTTRPTIIQLGLKLSAKEERIYSIQIVITSYINPTAICPKARNSKKICDHAVLWVILPRYSPMLLFRYTKYSIFRIGRNNDPAIPNIAPNTISKFTKIYDSQIT